MIIRINDRNVDIEDLMEFITSGRKKFEIEIFHDNDEWIQIFCDDSVISIVQKNKKELNYWGNIKKNILSDIVYSYYSNPNDFNIRKDCQNNQSNKQSSKESLRNLFLAFLISVILTIIQSIFIVIDSTNSGSVFDKLFEYYFDTSIVPYQKSLPMCAIVFFVFSIFYGVKVIKERNTNKK